jgi:hypothetical protein
MTGLSDLIIPQVISYKKQLGEIEVLVKSTPVPNPQLVQGMKKLAQMKEALTAAGGDLSQLDAAVQELQALPPEVCSMPIDAKREDNDTEAMTCWLWINGEEGRRAKRSNKEGYDNVCLHFDEHTAAAQAKAAAAGGPAKPPSTSINYKDVAMADKGASDQILQKAGITPSPGAEAPAPVPPGPGAKPPAAPIPASTPQGAGGVPKR